jgi:cob(I)alamin adenosyltransferase
MNISTKKGDMGFTSTINGERVPKFDLVVEATGVIDEANSFLGLARATTRTKRIKRTIFFIQERLFIVGAELSASKNYGRPPKKRIVETDIKWVESLVETLEEALALPPGFVAFGQEKGSSQLDVARTEIRKAERIIAKLNNKDLLENKCLLKYMNRLSDLLFLLACLEEKSAAEKHEIGRKLLAPFMAEPGMKKLAINSGIIIMLLSVVIVLLLVFHKPGQNDTRSFWKIHQSEMKKMHYDNNYSEYVN